MSFSPRALLTGGDPKRWHAEPSDPYCTRRALTARPHMSVRPPLDLRQPVQAAIAFLTHPAYFWQVGLLVLLGDALLTQLIIRFVPCAFRACSAQPP